MEQQSPARRSFAGAGDCSFPGGRRPPPPGAAAPSPVERPATVPLPPARASPARAAAQRPDPPPPPSSAATTIITSPAAPLTLTLPTAAHPPSASPALAESAGAPPPQRAGLRAGEALPLVDPHADHKDSTPSGRGVFFLWNPPGLPSFSLKKKKKCKSRRTIPPIPWNG